MLKPKEYKVKVFRDIKGKTHTLSGSCDKLPILGEVFDLLLEGGLSTYLISFGEILNIQKVDSALGSDLLFRSTEGIFELKLLKSPKRHSSNVINLELKRNEYNARSKGVIILYPELPENHKSRSPKNRMEVRKRIDLLCKEIKALPKKEY